MMEVCCLLKKKIEKTMEWNGMEWTILPTKQKKKKMKMKQIEKLKLKMKLKKKKEKEE